MKKYISIFFSVVIVLALILANVQMNVQAKSGDWNTGKEVKVNLDDNPGPDGMTLMSTGVSVTKTTTICYPFPKAQFGWAGNIYQLFDGKWYKLTTTTKWTPNSEGKLMACAKVYSKATYALFGEFVGTPTPDSGDK